MLSFILFADDTSIFFRHSNIHRAAEIVNKELKSVSVWFKSNKLTLNIDKTNFMIFHPYQRPACDIELFIDSQNICSVNTTKFLGVIIDKHVRWNPYIQKVKTTVSKVIGVMYRIKSFVPKSVLLSIYKAIVLPHLHYCVISWGNASPSLVNSIFLLQKRAIRIVCNTSYYQHTTPLFNELKLLAIFEIFKLQIGIFMYKWWNNLLPSNFSNQFTLTRSIHSYFMRNNLSLNVPYTYSSMACFTLRYYGPRFWNFLDPKVVSSKSLQSFKNNLKIHLLRTILDITS